MNAAVLAQSGTLPWSFSPEDERRFRRILRNVVAVFLVFGIVMPWLPVFEAERTVVPEPPPRLARLILEQPKPPPPPPQKPVKVEPPKPEPVPVVKPKPVPKPTPKPVAIKPDPKPQPKPQVSARERAERSGLLAMKDALADLRDNTAVAQVSGSKGLQRGGGEAKVTERAVITSGVAKASGGINTGALSRDTGGTRLAGHSTARVSSPVATGAGEQRAASPGRKAGRTIEEIQMVFDRNKGAVFSMYNRALRSDPGLQGKVVLKLTIAPSGSVRMCMVLSSELRNPELEHKLAERIKLFDFGAKDVEEVTISYPIDFLPA